MNNMNNLDILENTLNIEEVKKAIAGGKMVEDTLIDLANYCIMTLIELEEED